MASLNRAEMGAHLEMGGDPGRTPPIKTFPAETFVKAEPMNQSFAKDSASAPRSPMGRTQSPFVAYPVVPFWTACPLPFSPLTYPQMVVPNPGTNYMGPVGPQILRSGSKRADMTASGGAKASYGGHVHRTYQHLEPKITPASSRREVISERQRNRRSKRALPKPNPALSEIARERERDAQGKFLTDRKKLNRIILDLEGKLQASSEESEMLKKKLQETQMELNHLRQQSIQLDDMYRRQVYQSQMLAPHGTVPQVPIADGGIPTSDIYSPFRSGNAMVNAFKEKIDFAEVASQLKPASVQEGKEEEKEESYSVNNRGYYIPPCSPCPTPTSDCQETCVFPALP